MVVIIVEINTVIFISVLHINFCYIWFKNKYKDKEIYLHLHAILLYFLLKYLTVKMKNQIVIFNPFDFHLRIVNHANFT